MHLLRQGQAYTGPWERHRFARDVEAAECQQFDFHLLVVAPLPSRAEVAAVRYLLCSISLEHPSLLWRNSVEFAYECCGKLPDGGPDAVFTAVDG